MDDSTYKTLQLMLQFGMYTVGVITAVCAIIGIVLKFK